MADHGTQDVLNGKDLPPTPRIRLDSMERVRREMTSIYAEAKHGRRDVAAASKLANMLALIGRLIEGGELEKRLDALEKLQGGPQP